MFMINPVCTQTTVTDVIVAVQSQSRHSVFVFLLGCCLQQSERQPDTDTLGGLKLLSRSVRQVLL